MGKVVHNVGISAPCGTQPMYFRSRTDHLHLGVVFKAFSEKLSGIRGSSRVAQWSKKLHLSARGVTTDSLTPSCITTGPDWESHWAAHNSPSVVRDCPGGAVIVNNNLFLTDLPS